MDDEEDIGYMYDKENTSQDQRTDSNQSKNIQ